jgi:hypothetical protein
MEEILSSIRRIIAEEEKDRGGPTAKADEAPSPAAAEDDVLELTDIADERPPAASDDTLELTEPLVEPTPDDRSKEDMPVATTTKDDGLISAGAASASASARAKLTRAAAAEERPAPLAGRTVEDLLAELLRPILKDWLDQNLAGVVERVVEQEVKKLARRAELM